MISQKEADNIHLKFGYYQPLIFIDISNYSVQVEAFTAETVR